MITKELLDALRERRSMPGTPWTPLMHARNDLDIAHTMYQEGRLAIGGLLHCVENVMKHERGDTKK